MNQPAIKTRDYTFLGTTQSLCPECLDLVPAKIISRGKRVYFRKSCKTHGPREDFICSDSGWYDRYDYALPARVPSKTFVESDRGCPFDCGLCEEHEQHTCIGVLEITDNCNLTCPMCYAASSPGQKHKSMDEICSAIDALVRAEGRADVLQISGGEPTTHPDFEIVLDYALSKPIEYVMINTNGIRFAKDDRLIANLASHKDRVEVYFQLDGLDDKVHLALRGTELGEIKLAALERLGQAGLHVTIVTTLQGGVNIDQLGRLLEFAASRPWITGLSLQPATYSGRHFLPEDLEKRITFPDVIQALCEQSNGRFGQGDFFPLPCAHPNCHILSLAFRHEGRLIPLTRFLDAKSNLDLLANGLSFTREDGKRLVQLYMARQNCCGPTGCCDDDDTTVVPLSNPDLGKVSDRFFAQALAKELGAKQLFRITITSFLDAYNFDVRRVMKCCTHHILPSGHIIPFCAYNVLYRNGHIPLPPLRIDQANSSITAK